MFKTYIRKNNTCLLVCYIFSRYFIILWLFSITDIYLIIIGNLLGLGNIYLTYRYMKYLNETKCECSNTLLKNLIIIIYIFTASIIAAFFIGIPVLYLSKIK